MDVDKQHFSVTDEKEPGSPTTESAGKALIDEAQIVPLTSGERKTTTRWELLAYYVYYSANSGIGLQNILTQAGYDPNLGRGTPCGDGEDAACVLDFAGYPQSVTAIVLNLSAISFAIEVFLNLIIGSTADYGTWRPWVTILFTVAGWATGFAWLGVKEAQYPAAVALYLIGTIAADLSIAYYSAAMPGLVRDQPHMQASEAAVLAGYTSPEAHLQLDVLERNRVADYAFRWNSFPCVVWFAIAAGILAAMGTADNNTHSLNVLIAYFTAILVVGTVPWFLAEQRRPGQKLPAGTNYLTVGVVNMWHAIKEVRKLKQVLLYLIAYLILSDTFTTTTLLIGTLTNSVVAFDARMTTYMNMANYGAQGIGIGAMWLVQRRFNLSTKTVLLFNVVCIVGLCLWGFIGIWVPDVGYKSRAEVWVYQVYYGLLVCQWYQLPLTFISDLVPRPKMFLFWSLFNISGTASAFFGPFITSAIIDRSGGNSSMAFAFLLPLSVLGTIILWFVNSEKAVFEAKKYLEEESRTLYRKEKALLDR